MSELLSVSVDKDGPPGRPSLTVALKDQVDHSILEAFEDHQMSVD